MIDWLQHEWVSLASKYTEESSLINDFWSEIKTHYAGKSRYYHNTSHIYNMLIQLQDFSHDIVDIDALKFAIWYHDIIYKSTKKDNEEKSADFAKKCLKTINFNQKRTENVQKLIISTKKHQLIIKENNDNAYLLDLDLSILGTPWETYKVYIENIRKEYKIYPNFMYNPGRKKVLMQFINRDRLYFTDRFKNKFETQARLNIKREIELL